MPKQWKRALVVAMAMMSLAAGPATRASGQDYASPPPSEPVAPPPLNRFVMPDVRERWMDWNQYDGAWFSTRVTLVPIVDYTAFWQDADSVAQVGEQVDQWDLRTFRVMTRGQFKLPVAVDYFASLEIKGSDHRNGSSGSALGLTDLYLAVPIKRLGTLTFGKIKEPWVYEMVGDAANLQQEERVLSPFFVTRNVGVRLSNTAANSRMTWAAGWFNDWWPTDQRYQDSGNQFSARVTGVPQLSADGSRYLHLGISARYAGADEGVLRFRGRPESNVSSYYLDTGDIPADHANEAGVEALWANGPFFVTSELVGARVDARSSEAPNFWGGYVTISYILTGEHRPYDRQVGYARRVMPAGKWGAFEVFGRYTHVDLTDAAIDGGVLDKGTLGLNWWATRHWRLGLDYGLSRTERFEIRGMTRSIHPRFQWVY